ncbi:MAG: UDP-3-O-(3-hydroxymyristoyl)glucosamine N-acyltransferase [Paracoccaceae bacterium]|jgi:UDP-3-O-[3-hydroxymyristoyl] glucosamine N-acyltransferase
MSAPFIFEEVEAKVGLDNHFAGVGLATTSRPRTLTFLDQARYALDIEKNANIVGVITTDVLAQILPKRLEILLAEDPRHAFYSLHNRLVALSSESLPVTRVHPSAIVHPTCYIAPRGVTIGAEVFIEPHVTILEGVEIGKGSVVRSGARIGVEGFEHKRTTRGLISVRHDGRVEIAEDVEIGPNNTVAKGLMGRDTRIGRQTKLDALVHIAHCVHVGARCFIPASAMIAGSVTIGDDVWIGPNASISSQIDIGDGAFVTLGSVVTRDVPSNQRVTGNFAIPHDRHMQILRQQLRKQGQSDE